jgi:PH (Pleckstrin Homology) domain-containing protein
MNPDQKPTDDQPVAYDNQGRPLYLRPQAPQQVSPKGPPDPTHPEELQVVQVTRSSDPVAVSVPADIQAKHEASRRTYPKLNLSAGEYVILDIRRHPIGLVSIWAVAFILAIIIVGAWWFALSHPGSPKPIVPASSVGSVSGFTAGLLLLISLFAWAATVIYRGNIFILTNESIIQRVQNSLISQEEKTINLENIKDARFTQHGFLQYLIGYGTIELTTEGDQNNYNFKLVAKPKEQVGVINNVVEAVKYGRPVEDAIKSVVT